MKIGLDYDGTYTADQFLWNAFIGLAKSRGHEVIIYTARNEKLDNNDDLKELCKHIRVVFCDGVAKKHIALMEAQHDAGHKVDIWIDDKPESVVQNSVATLEQLVEWRKVRV